MTGPDTKTILIVSCQHLPTPNEPSTGGSLRMLMLGKALKAIGQQVLYSLPQGCFDGPIPGTADLVGLCHSADNIGEIVDRCRPDMVLFGNWGLAAKADELDVPVIVDVNGSLILENHFRRHTVLLNDELTKIKALEKADLVIAGSNAQKSYLIAWGLMAGMDPEAFPIEVVPFSLSPDLPEPHRSSEPVGIMAGYDWPWLKGHRAAKIVNDRMNALAKGRLVIYTGDPPYSDVLPGEDSSLNATGNLSLADLTKAQINGPVPFDQLIDVMRQCSFALDIWDNNLERELAFSSRTVAYLWSGLPVITSARNDLGQLISDYRAGWIIDENSDKELSDLVDALLKDPEITTEYGANARKLVKAHLTWDKTIAPLARFCASPVKRRHRSPLLIKLEERQDLHHRLNRKISELNDEIKAHHRKIDTLGEENRLLAHVHRRPKGPAIFMSAQLFWKKARKWLVVWPLLFYLMVITTIGFRLHTLSLWWRGRQS